MIALRIFFVFCYLWISISSHPVDFAEDELYLRSLLETNQPLAVDPKEYRLNYSVTPTNYRIELQTYFEQVENPTESPQYDPFTFDGNVRITLSAYRSNIKEIELHADASLTIERVGITENGFPVTISNWTTVAETQKMIIKLEEPMTRIVDYILGIQYKGVLDDKMKGFYRSYYKENNKTEWLAGTQFQQTSARKAFPCFDEPHFKATFELIMKHPDNYNETITNTKILGERVIANGIITETFKKTPIMSSYLMAFVVQKFKAMKTEDKHFGVFARPEALSQTEYAFKRGQDILKTMGEWINFKFNDGTGIEKVDMIAIPDFSAGAMENWGAMIYRYVIFTTILISINTKYK